MLPISNYREGQWNVEIDEVTTGSVNNYEQFWSCTFAPSLATPITTFTISSDAAANPKGPKLLQEGCIVSQVKRHVRVAALLAYITGSLCPWGQLRLGFLSDSPLPPRKGIIPLRSWFNPPLLRAPSFITPQL
jgi:hypothetical protein